MKTTGAPPLNLESPAPIGNIIPNTGVFTDLEAIDITSNTLITDDITTTTINATTVVASIMNASLLDGADWDAPPTIGGVTPGVGIFSGLDCASGTMNGSFGTVTPGIGKFTGLDSTSGALNGTIGSISPQNGFFAGVDCSSGSINATIGAVQPYNGFFNGVDCSSGAINASIGGVTPYVGNFTGLSSSSGNINAVVGNVTPNLGHFTTLSTNGIPFTYAEGTWTPRFAYVTSAGVSNPNASIIVLKNTGTYTKIGRMVRLEFSTQVESTGNDTFTDSLKFPCLTDLPFRNDGDFTSSNYAKADYPNGYVAMFPTPLIPTFPGVKQSSFPGYNDPYPLYAWNIVGIDRGTWIPDGRTMLMNGSIQVHNPFPLPGFPTIYSAVGDVYNFDYGSAIVTYYIEFTGSVVYFTDS